MKCPKCGSENVNVQLINQVKLKDKHKGFMYWCFVGWWWIPMKWFFFTLPALIIAIFKPKKQKAVNKTITQCVCQSCAYTWKA